MKPTTIEFTLGDTPFTLETGRIARQATGSVMVRSKGTAVLCTVVAEKTAREGQGFFPLTVNYQERTYAAGFIPGGFFRREGRPTEKETLTSRLIDRPLRPLFPKAFMNEVQVVATVMSADRDQDPDIASLIGCSAAVAVSGVPFAGPVGAVRVGFQDNMYLLNPTHSALQSSQLNMVVAGTESAVLMVESEAKELSEDQMFGALLFGHQEMQVAIRAINDLAEQASAAPWTYSPPVIDESLTGQLSGLVADDLGEAFKIVDKGTRQERVHELKDRAVAELASTDQSEWDQEQIDDAFSDLEKSIVRGRVLNGEPRIDGRGPKDVRDIDVEAGFLPNTHGSALFQRGETQAIVVTTLGTPRDAAKVESLSGTTNDSFLLHYNFPPYSVGEAGMMGAPKRREIGHGRLARRAISTVLPDSEEYPFTIRVVSEITESNGSSSMASVCGTSLALMDAGVPITGAVAGVAMGLVKQDDRYRILTDILGDEDHLGDMDFKVAGTADGVTALQMDIKIDGITDAIMEEALNQAREARLHILSKMNECLKEPRDAVASTAPRIIRTQIPSDKVGAVIGPRGATIKSITEETNTNIEVDGNTGQVVIYAESSEASDLAQQRIKEAVGSDSSGPRGGRGRDRNKPAPKPEVGKVYDGTVQKVENYGAFVRYLPPGGSDGLVHISEVSENHIPSLDDFLEVGQKIKVVVTGFDEQERPQLSMKRVGEYQGDSPPF